jgi:hypothetical protein
VWSVLTFLVGSFVWAADKGYVIGEEGYYLLSSRFPHAAPPAVTQFGLIVDAITLHHPLTVPGYRVLGLVALLIGAVALMLSFLTFVDRRLPRYRRAMPATTSLCAFAATAGLLGLSWLMRTISYFTLTTVFAEFAVASVLLATASTPSRSWRPPAGQVALSACAGLMLVLLLFTKFPAALITGGLLVVFLPVAMGWRRGLVLVAALAAGAAISMLALTTDFFGGPFSLHGLRDGARIASQGSHNAREILTADWESASTYSFFSLASVLVGVMFAAPVIARLAPARFRVALGWALAVPGLLAVTLAVRAWSDHTTITYVILGGFTIGLVFVLSTAWLARRLDPSTATAGLVARSGPPRESLLLTALVALMVALPFATAIGTNTGLFHLSINCGAAFACLMALAWGARGLVLDRPARQTVLAYLPIGFASLLFALLIAHGTLVEPYGLATSISGQTETLTGIGGLSTMRVDPATKRLLTELQAKVDAVSSFRPGDPIVTGPLLGGMAYALGGWLPGTEYYNDSPPTCLALEQVPDDLARTDLVIRDTNAPHGFDDCLREVMPGYPEQFDVRAVVDGPMVFGPGEDRLEILVRRP